MKKHKSRKRNPGAGAAAVLLLLQCRLILELAVRLVLETLLCCWGKQALGKNRFSFPEIGRVGTCWEEGVMTLWRQQDLHPHQPVRCQVETRWQMFHHKGHPPGGGYVLGQGVHMSGANTVKNGGQPFLSSYCVLSQY